MFALTFLSREYSTDNGFDMLTGVGVPSQFFPLTEPFTTLLADALVRLLKFDRKG